MKSILRPLSLLLASALAVCAGTALANPVRPGDSRLPAVQAGRAPARVGAKHGASENVLAAIAAGATGLMIAAVASGRPRPRSPQ